jgi:hypothetical protein
MLLGVVGPVVANERGVEVPFFFNLFVLVGIVLRRSFVPHHHQ